MAVLAAALSSIAALLGVLLGARLTSRAQDKVWRRDQDQRLLDARRNAYKAFMVAIREYITYVERPDANLKLQKHSTEDRMIPVFEGDGVAFKQLIETTYIELKMLVLDQDILNKAHVLARAARRIAVASRTKKLDQPMLDKLLRFYDIEREFVNAVRADLGIEGSLTGSYDASAQLP